ncbi:hypothetical protein GQ473_01020 [archaeon]|nr:hypothetical protein [archaeon]
MHNIILVVEKSSVFSCASGDAVDAPWDTLFETAIPIVDSIIIPPPQKPPDWVCSFKKVSISLIELNFLITWSAVLSVEVKSEG